MSDGTVKWFNTKKGYGFISTEDGTDIFVHYSNITGDGYRALAEGDSVSFDIIEGEKGLRAENVVQGSAKKSETAQQSEKTSETEAVAEIEAAAETEAVAETETAAETEAVAENE